MKYSILLLIIVSLSSCLFDQSGFIEDSQDKSALMAADSTAIMLNFNKQEECWNAHDLECYVEAYYHSNDIQTISRAGVTKGYSNILRDYKTYFPADRMGQLHFDEIELKRLSDEYYYVFGRFNLNYQSPDTLYQGWFSVLMEKIDGDWYLISDHSS